MKKKDRLGSDPLSFIKETDNENNQEESSQDASIQEDSSVQEDSIAQANSSKSNGVSPEKETVREESTKDGTDETVDLYNLHIQEKKLDSNLVSLLLDGEISIYNATEVRQYLAENIKIYDGIEMDLSNVNRMDTAGFQLILAVRQEANKNGKKLKLLNPDNEVERVFDLYGEKCQ